MKFAEKRWKFPMKIDNSEWKLKIPNEDWKFRMKIENSQWKLKIANKNWKFPRKIVYCESKFKIPNENWKFRIKIENSQMKIENYFPFLFQFFSCISIEQLNPVFMFSVKCSIGQIRIWDILEHFFCFNS